MGTPICSLPTYWEQINAHKYKPIMQISEEVKRSNVLQKPELT